jgi:serine/threonine-protein kinase SIK2
MQTAMESAHFTHDTSPQAYPAGQFHTPQRILTSSNSFDSKSNIPNFSPFHMSAEAARLFQTLQQSPLPLPQTDVINFC